MSTECIPRVAVLDFEEDDCEPGMGRFLADSIASGLRPSKRLRIVDRRVWQEVMGEAELNRKVRFHPAWAAERVLSFCSDAAVIGKVTSLPNDRFKMTIMLVDAGCVVLEKVDFNSVRAVVRALNSRCLMRAIRCRYRPLEARVEGTHGTSVILSLDHCEELQQSDRLTINRILEDVPDPFFEPARKRWTRLEAAAGEVLVVEPGVRFVLAKYFGALRLRVGECVTLALI